VHLDQTMGDEPEVQPYVVSKEDSNVKQVECQVVRDKRDGFRKFYNVTSRAPKAERSEFQTARI